MRNHSVSISHETLSRFLEAWDALNLRAVPARLNDFELDVIERMDMLADEIQRILDSNV